MICPKSLTEVINKEIEWLWQPYIPFGKITLIQGDTGIGKTSLMVKLIADLSNGIVPPTMFHRRLIFQERAEPIRSYYVTVENCMDDTIAPLFDKYGGNRCFVDFQNEDDGHFILTGNEIEECVSKTGSRLIIVDLWQQFLDNISSSDNNGLRRMICDVQAATEKTGVAVVLAGNFTKNLGSDLRRGMGGSELNNTLRSILTVQDDPGGDPAVRILRATKMSLLGKEMTLVVIRQDDNWLLSYEDYSYSDDDTQDAPVDEEDPKQFLQRLLRDGPLDSRTIEQLGKNAGIKMNRLYRIRQQAGVVIEQQPDKSSLWRLNSFRKKEKQINRD